VACLAVAIVVLVLVLWSYPHLDAHTPAASQLGAELGAPANPAESYGAARPEVYFLFLFQTLKYLEEFPPIVGAIVVIAIVIALIWLASRKGQVWAAWLLALFAALSVVVVMSYYTGGLPTWLGWLRPAKPPTPVQTVLDTISALMQVAAILFYFSSNKARA